MDYQSLAPGKVIVTGAYGNPQAKIVFIGDSPQPAEAVTRKPNEGLLKIVMDVFPDSVTAEDIYYINAIPYIVPKGKDAKVNTEYTQKAAMNCRDYVAHEIGKHPRQVIVALGNAAMWALTGDTSYKITQIRGQLFPSPLAQVGIVASVHPSYLIRGGGSYSKFRTDINYALDLMNGLPPKTWDAPEYEVSQSEDDVRMFVDATFQAAEELDDFEIGADIETDGFDHLDDKVLCLGWCVDPKKVYIVQEEHMGALHYRDFLKARRFGGHFSWTWHNGKFDVKFLRQLGHDAGVDDDTMLMSYTMEEKRGFHDLDQVASDELGAPMHKDMLEEYLPNKKCSYRVIPKPILHEYLSFDAAKTKSMSMRMKPRVLADSKNTTLYQRVLLPASELLSRVEHRGMLVDMDKRAENIAYFEGIMQEHHATLNRIVLDYDPTASYKDTESGKFKAGINPNSPAQVGELLYKKLRLAKSDLGTGVDILEKLPQHDAVKALMKHRKAAKAFGTYVKPLPEQISSDGAVHSTYLIHGTATGRLSSRGPNMQNQPRDPKIRGQFKAREGYRYCEMDLDQAELRCLAALSGDTALCAVYENKGTSLHKVVSLNIWGEDWGRRYALDQPGDPEYDQAKEEYMRTKALNFGIVYGREAPSIAQEFEIPVAEAQRMIDGWANQFPDAWNYINRCRMAPIRGQNLVTPFGRRKRAGVVAREAIRDLQNEAANFPHQSIASDITLYSAVKVYDWLIARDCHIVNLIHDAIIVEYPDNEDLFRELARHVTGEMMKTPIEWGIDRIPFSADAKTGLRWGELRNHDF